MELYLPERFEDQDIVDFLRFIHEYKDEPTICTNYSSVQFVKPFATLLFAVGILDFVSYRRSRRLKTTSKGHKENHQALTYLAHLGFFKHIGLDTGKKPNEAPGGERYLPITILAQYELDKEGVRLQDSIERECDRLSQIIYSGKENIMRATMLSYGLREIVRNVFEHAEIDKCVLLAQKWNDGFAEIAIADRGIGLTQSLKEVYQLNSPREAIQVALQPGISSDTSPENDDKWQNSGFGLYVVSNLGGQLGEFAIASDGCIMFSHEGEISWYDVPINGTAVKLRVNTDEAEYFPNILHNIVAEGENVAKEIAGAKKSASKKSKISR